MMFQIIDFLEIQFVFGLVYSRSCRQDEQKRIFHYYFKLEDQRLWLYSSKNISFQRTFEVNIESDITSFGDEMLLAMIFPIILIADWLFLTLFSDLISEIIKLHAIES